MFFQNIILRCHHCSFYELMRASIIAPFNSIMLSLTESMCSSNQNDYSLQLAFNALFNLIFVQLNELLIGTSIQFLLELNSKYTYSSLNRILNLLERNFIFIFNTYLLVSHFHCPLFQWDPAHTFYMHPDDTIHKHIEFALSL
jgi:hypothetical protein